MRILGIDPGLSLTGYGCIDLADDSAEAVVVEAGVLRLNRNATLAIRLRQLFDDISELLNELKPERLVIEQLFSHYRYVKTSIQMGHARGVVLLAGQMKGVELSELAATEVKKSITGHGHATKQQMQLAVMSQCNLDVLPDPPDVADALAIALCDARRFRTDLVSEV